MISILRYLVGAVVAFLPPRYRPNIDSGVGLASGLAEIVVTLLALVLKAIVWTRALTDVDFHNDLVWGGGMGAPGAGIFALAAFWMNPLHILIFYFVIEGIVRTLAALVGKQVLGSFPLYAISAVHNRVSRKAYERSLGELVADEVERVRAEQGYELKVSSCRPKLHWNPYMTVEFDGEFYQYFKEEYGPLPRRFVYYLRKNPVGRVVVVIDRYQIDNVLKPEPNKQLATTSFWGER
jgi:hypothetical protein